MSSLSERTVRILPVMVDAGPVQLPGDLGLPEGATGVVLFAHGSGSSRHSPRNQAVSRALQQAGLATLLIDLLTADEEAVDLQTQHLRFDIELLAQRLVGSVGWLKGKTLTSGLSVGLFGASTGGGAALVAAAQLPDSVHAVVSRGGRPDLAGAALEQVCCPTLFLVGELDTPVIGLNQEALARLVAPVKQLAIIPRATHLFEEPGTLEEVARCTINWFRQYLGGGYTWTANPGSTRKDTQPP